MRDLLVYNPDNRDDIYNILTKEVKEVTEKWQEILSLNQKIKGLPILVPVVPQGVRLKDIGDAQTFILSFKTYFSHAYQFSIPIAVSRDPVNMNPFLCLRIRSKKQTTQQEPFFIICYPSTISFDPAAPNHINCAILSERQNDNFAGDAFELLKELITDQHQEYELDFPVVAQKKNV